jgi:hypothetical protein
MMRDRRSGVSGTHNGAMGRRRRIVSLIPAMLLAATLASATTTPAHAGVKSVQQAATSTCAFFYASGWLGNSDQGCRVNLVAFHSGKCLDVQGSSTADGTPIIQYSCGSTLNQRFGLIPVPGTSNLRFSIRPSSSGKCMDVSGASTADRTPIIQHTCNSPLTLNQEWGLHLEGADADGVGFFSLRPRHAIGMCADVSGGSTANYVPLIQYQCQAVLHQRFQLAVV